MQSAKCVSAPLSTLFSSLCLDPFFSHLKQLEDQ